MNKLKNIKIIAEVKTESPFGFKSKESWNKLFDLANEVGDIISVHTDSLWGGSFKLLEQARRLTDKPILAKGHHPTSLYIRRAVEAGADYVLTIGRDNGCEWKYQDKLMIEAEDLINLGYFGLDRKAVWNSRDIITGKLKKENFKQARAIFPGWLCQASNIRTIEDVDLSADAVLVGAHLREFSKSLK